MIKKTSPCHDCYYLSESTRGTNTNTIFCSPYLTDVKALQARRSHEKLLLKLAQTRSDIYFFPCCKKLYLVSNGFFKKEPFRHHPDVSQATIDKACAKLSNIVLHKVYAKQKRLLTLLESSSLYIMKLSINHLIKLKRLYFSINCSTKKPSNCCVTKTKNYNSSTEIPLAFPLHSSLQDRESSQIFLTAHQPSMHFRKQTKISTVSNLSNIKLSAIQTSQLEKCISFCPTHKLDLVELCHDINEYTSLLQNKEFYYLENSSGISNRLMDPFKTASTWTPPLDATITSILTFSK